MNRLVIYFSFVLVVLCTNVHGQKTELKITITPTLTSLRGNSFTKENFNPAMNFSVGVGVNHFIEEKSLLSVELLFDKKGGGKNSNMIYENPENQQMEEGKLHLRSNFSYLTLAMELRHRLGKKIKYEFGAGLYTGYLIKQVLKGKFNEHKDKIDETDSYKKMDFGLSMSFNTYIPVNANLYFIAGLNDKLGFLNVSTEPLINDGSIKHNSLGLLLGLGVKL
jgi:hypothetical protein